ncbi:MAG TPA: hypothetical protein VFA69_09730 [Candidatus Nitrosotalea sp.]|nr:hypothetical protein [Candidatus Nitrosotalea sp.]
MWSDGNGGGSFSSAFCDLSSGTCSISYTSSASAQSAITITATYSGDATHQTSSGTLPLAILTMHTTSVAITPNSASFVPGNVITFTSTVSDTSNSPTTPSGMVSWSDGSAGGSFSSSSCTLSSGTCTTSYTPASGAPNSITITATYAGDGTHQTNSGTSQLSHGSQDTSSVLVTSSSSTISSGGQVTVTATVTDTSNSQNIPTGTITWSDGNIGGILSSPSCNLSSGVCNITYTAPSNIQNSITITASYSGDSIHTTNSGTFVLTSNLLAPTTVTVSPNPASYVSGNTLTFTATVADTSNSQNIPTGVVTWSDGNTGGVFGTSSCTLASGTCTTSYTPASNSPESVTITATYGGDGIHQTNAGTSALTINAIHATTLAVTPNPASVSPGGSVTFTATVTDSSSSPITPTSSVSWSDGNGGGVFDQTSCTLASGSCTVSYTPATNAPNAITITASYNGDNTHQASTGSSQLTANVLHPTTASITPNPDTFTAGTPVTFTITISDTKDPSSSMIGIVKWTDNGAGGSFSPDACIISGNHCSLDYTPPSNPSGSITITASYAGDSTHSASSATSSLTINTTTSPSTSQSSTTSEPETQPPSTTQSSPTTQSNVSPPTQKATQPSTSTTQSNTSPPQSAPQTTNTSPPTTTQSTTQSNTHTTQSDSKNPTTQTTPSVNINQQSPLATISKAISNVVSELESSFKRL